jgi:hypothetical protein
MDDGPSAFRRYLAAHNRHVLTVSAGSLFVVAVVWVLTYFGLYWLILLALTIQNPLEAQPPVSYPVHFIFLATLIVAGVALATWNRPAPRPRDQKDWSEIALDFLLLLPRATVGAVENLGAIQRLNRRELTSAWALLQSFAEQPFLPLTALSLEIPNERMRERIIRALQFSQLIELRERDGEWGLGLRQSAGCLIEQHFRLR